MAKIHDSNPPEADMHDDDDDATLDGASDSGVDDGEVPPEPATTRKPPDSTGVKAAKAFGTGLLCIVGIPVLAAVGTVGGVLYGAGKVLEGVGKGLAAGPEAAFNAADSGKGEQKPTAPPKRKPKPGPSPSPSKPKSESRSKSA